MNYKRVMDLLYGNIDVAACRLLMSIPSINNKEINMSISGKRLKVGITSTYRMFMAFHSEVYKPMMNDINKELCRIASGSVVAAYLPVIMSCKSGMRELIQQIEGKLDSEFNSRTFYVDKDSLIPSVLIYDEPRMCETLYRTDIGIGIAPYICNVGVNPEKEVRDFMESMVSVGMTHGGQWRFDRNMGSRLMIVCNSVYRVRNPRRR